MLAQHDGGVEDHGGALAGDPGVRQHLVSSQPGRRVLDEESHDEVLCLGGDSGPVLVREDQPALLDVGEEKFLAGRAGLATVPATVGSTVSLEGRVAAHENVGDNSEGPKITFLVVPKTHFNYSSCKSLQNQLNVMRPIIG